MESEDGPRKRRKLSPEHVGDAGLVTKHNESSALDRKPEVPPANGADLESDSNSDTDGEASKKGPPQAAGSNDPNDLQTPMSKNALKRIRKAREWEEGREYRKAKKKQKLTEKRARKRAAKAKGAEDATVQDEEQKAPRPRRPTRLPVTFIIDCGFDELMSEKERISLGSQLTRSYSDNSKAPYQAHLAISSWGGALKERFDTILSEHYKNWRGVQFEEGDFVRAAEVAKEKMHGPRRGKLASVFEKFVPKEAGPREPIPEQPAPAEATSEQTRKKDVEVALTNGNASVIANDPNTEANGQYAVSKHPGSLEIPNGTAQSPKPSQSLPEPEVVYLTSDSPYTLDELKPYSTYIIGGLVDKNRHKGICYKTACDKNIKTAKLPIGDYMEMQSRFVLATNHVVEIMVRWLECGDWGEAFMKVIPKRKGGKLRPDAAGQDISEPEDDTSVDSGE